MNYYILDEHYEGNKPVSYHSLQIYQHRQRFPETPITATYLDSQAFSKTLMGAKGTPREDELYSVADEYFDHKVFCVPTQKDWDVGYNRISELLVIDEDHINPITGQKGAPHLLVSDSCAKVIWEFETHKWKLVKNGLEPRKDEPVDGNDHHMDGLNGFIASRPEVTRPYVQEKEDWLEKELDGWDHGGSTHMSF